MSLLAKYVSRCHREINRFGFDTERKKITIPEI